MYVDIPTADDAELVAARDAINEELAVRHQREAAPAWVAEAVRSALASGIPLHAVQAAVDAASATPVPATTPDAVPPVSQ